MQARLTLPRTARAARCVRRRGRAGHEPRADHGGQQPPGAGDGAGARRRPARRRALDHRQSGRARDALARHARDRPDLAGSGGDHPSLVQGLEPQRAREPRLEAGLGGVRQRARALRRLPGHGTQGARRAGVRHRLGRPAQPLRRDERRASGRAEAGRDARPDGLLPRLRRDEPQAARARGDAAVLQAEEEDRGRRALRHQPDRLEHAQGRRAAPLDQARGAAGLGARQRLSPLTSGGAGLPRRGGSPESSSPTSCSRSWSATPRARTRAVPSSSTWPPSTSRSRAVSASTGSTSEATCRRRPSARSSTWPAASRKTTGARSRRRSTSRSPTSSTSSRPTRRRSSRRTS